MRGWHQASSRGMQAGRCKWGDTGSSRKRVGAGSPVLDCGRLGRRPWARCCIACGGCIPRQGKESSRRGRLHLRHSFHRDLRGMTGRKDCEEPWARPALGSEGRTGLKYYMRVLAPVNVVRKGRRLPPGE